MAGERDMRRLHFAVVGRGSCQAVYLEKSSSAGASPSRRRNLVVRFIRRENVRPLLQSDLSTLRCSPHTFGHWETIMNKLLATLGVGTLAVFFAFIPLAVKPAAVSGADDDALWKPFLAES